MARAGIYKSDVIRARKTILASGRYPSIDAVRAELGNTGSKATIHRYLKEIEEEEGGRQSIPKVRLTEPLQDLVARLADRLKLEAEGRIEHLVAQHAEEVSRFKQQGQSSAQEIHALKAALGKAEKDASGLRDQLEELGQRLQEEVTERARIAQHVSDLQDRLAMEEDLRRSLEENHIHARQALEHFRAASKEQREQDQRQHEQQVQFLQNEIRTLKKDLLKAQHEIASHKEAAAGLAADLSRSEKALRDARHEAGALKTAMEEAAAMKRHADQVERQLVLIQSEVAEVRSQNQELQAEKLADADTIQALREDLASAKAVASLHTDLMKQIQGLVELKAAPSGRQRAARKTASR